MRVLAINSSPRAQDSCTDKILIPLLAGMKKAGASIETVYLGKLKINHCKGCFNCWTKTPGKCIHKDDMPSVLQKYIEADFLILATPLYYFNVSGLMKNFLDRTLPLAKIDMKEGKSGLTEHFGRYKTNLNKILLVSPCGYPEFDHFVHLVSYVKFLAGNFGCEYIGEILRPAAEMLRIDECQPMFKSYYANLKVAGEQLITKGKISKKIRDELHKLFIQPKEYRKLVNVGFAKK